jgi:hypothetical protein
MVMHRISTTPRSQSCEGVSGLGGVAKGVLPSHSGCIDAVRSPHAVTPEQVILASEMVLVRGYQESIQLTGAYATR